jgi:hypothetical protein
VSLGFIKSLVDYIRPDVDEAANSTLTESKPKPEGGLNDRPDVQRALQYAADQARKRREAGEPIEDEPTALANSKYRLEEDDEDDDEEEWDEDHATDMVLNEMIEEVGDDFLQDKEAASGQPAAKQAAPKPAQPVKPSRPEEKRMVPVQSGNANSIALRKNMKGSPVAGSPSR